MLSLVKYMMHARYKGALQNIKEKIQNTRPHTIIQLLYWGWYFSEENTISKVV